MPKMSPEKDNWVAIFVKSKKITQTLACYHTFSETRLACTRVKSLGYIPLLLLASSRVQFSVVEDHNTE